MLRATIIIIIFVISESYFYRILLVENLLYTRKNLEIKLIKFFLI